MKIVKALLCILAVIFVSSCTQPKYIREVNNMKKYIPDVVAFVSEHKEDLDVIIDMKSRISLHYDIRSETIREYGYIDSIYTIINEFDIGHCESMNELENEKIKIIADNLPKKSSGYMFITSGGIRINFRETPAGAAVLDLCDFSTDYKEISGKYCEQIDDNWYIHIDYTPKG